MSCKIYRGFVPTTDQVLTMSDLLANTATVTVYAGLAFFHPQELLDYVTAEATSQLGLTLTWDLDTSDEQDLTYPGTLTIVTTAAGELGSYLGLTDPVVVPNTLHIASVPVTVTELELSPFVAPQRELFQLSLRGGATALADGTAESITTSEIAMERGSIRFRVLGSEMGGLLTEQDQWATGTPFTIFPGIYDFTSYLSCYMLGSQTTVEWVPEILADGIEWRADLDVAILGEG